MNIIEDNLIINNLDIILIKNARGFPINLNIENFDRNLNKNDTGFPINLNID